MRISDFDYELPEELIAQEPPERRDAARMLLVDRDSQTWHDSDFTSLPDYLRADDVLVLNNTRVFPARLRGERVPSGGAVELLLLREIEPNLWETLAKPARRLQIGARIVFGDGTSGADVMGTGDGGTRLIRFEVKDDFDRLVDQLGETPLPPYIKREQGSTDSDRERYQTIYANQRGAIAAPTAGLHFSPEVLAQVEARGVRVAHVTLHVGYATFEPVRVDEVSQHAVAAESFSIEEQAASLINEARQRGSRIVAVGTTTVRALESACGANGEIAAGSGSTELTIIPGYRFRAIDGLLTNFHLPRSSLLILVSAFAGRELALAAYQHAVTNQYRFYSYGDCMLIV
ncbi:MAG: tRNA preQ1(34) S-adenosylmethionine ribosyltransferase-isomerase QueA [Acidobacteriota bacterium]